MSRVIRRRTTQRFNLERLEGRTLLDAGAPNIQFAQALVGSGTSQDLSFSEGGLIQASLTDDQGRLYLAGTFDGTVNFNPIPNQSPITRTNASGPSDGFLAQYSADGRTLNWVYQIHVNNGEVFNFTNMTLSPQGDLLAIGSASSGVDLSGAIPANGIAFDSGGFLLRISADQGQFQSDYRFRDLNGNVSNNSPKAVEVDSTGSIFVAGHLIRGTTDFDPDPDQLFNVPGSNDSFIVKLNPDGSFDNVTILASDDGSLLNTLEVQSLAIASGTGDIYLAGAFGGTVDFDPGTGRVPRTGSGLRDLFILQLSDTGAFKNLETLSGPGSIGLMSKVALIESGAGVEGVLATGFFNDSDLTSENSSIILTNQNSSVSMVVGRWAPDLSQVQWAHVIGNDQPVFPASPGGLAFDSGGNVIVGGEFRGTLDLSSFGGDELVSQSISGTNSFYVIFDGNGIYQRGFRFGGPASSVFTGFSSPEEDTLVVSGWYSGGQFQIANRTLPSPATGAQNLFISKLTYQDVPKTLIGDYDGDGVADLALYKYDAVAREAVFHLRLTNNGNPDEETISITNVGANVIPIAGDFDGDRKTDVAVVDPFARLNNSSVPNATVWIILDSSRNNTRREVPFGAPGSLDRPAPAAFDGDGATDIATFRASSDLVPGAAQWFILPSNGPSAFDVVFGAPGGTDLPAPDDYDGDGRADIVTFRPVRTSQDIVNGVPDAAQWFILPSLPNDATFSERNGAFPILFGASGNADQPSPADFNGDGRADIVAFRSNSDINPGSADWSILRSAQPTPSFANGFLATFGNAGEIAAVADYTGDGNPDLTVFDRTTGQWSIRSGTGGAEQTVTFNHPLGQAVPVLSPLFFRLQATGNLPSQTSGVAMAARSSGLDAGLLLFDSGDSASSTSNSSTRSRRGSLIDSAIDSLMDEPLA